MKDKPIQVLIVDDSRVALELLSYIIEKDPDLEVAGLAENGLEALDWLQNHQVDVITMDVQMPAINGFEVTKKIMETDPVPIIIITSGYTRENSEMAFRSMQAGAMQILPKPDWIGHPLFIQQSQEIIENIKTLASIRVKRREQIPSKENRTFPKQDVVKEIKAVAIGASLGGPPAIQQILSKLPLSFPVPIFIVQHISMGFVEGFISWLQDYCLLPIHLASHNEKAKGGHVYIAPDKHEMEIKQGGIISLNPSQERQPSVGKLFQSMANAYGSQAVGVLLTGMGRDGAKELLLMKQRGAFTIAQDESSCVMFGMPREAIEIGAVSKVLPLNHISSVLIEITSKEI